MEKKYKILTKFIKDMSIETNNVQTYLFVKDIISRYHLTIAINSKAIKNQMIEIDTNLKLEDKEGNEHRSNFEIVFCTVIKLTDENIDKKELQKILLVEIQNEIYPDLEKSLLNVIHNSGFGEFKISKKIDFLELYNKQFS
tara:strand:- start:4131 stop:4553 length:423 start_codon:yes stop_codon:yes gene_type:complete